MFTSLIVVDVKVKAADGSEPETRPARAVPAAARTRIAPAASDPKRAARLLRSGSSCDGTHQRRHLRHGAIGQAAFYNGDAVQVSLKVYAICVNARSGHLAVVVGWTEWRLHWPACRPLWRSISNAG